MNDATREMITTLKAEKQAAKQASAAAKAEAATARQQLKEAKQRRLRAFRIQRDRENKERIRERRLNSSSTSDDTPTAQNEQRRSRLLSPEKLAQLGERIPGSRLFRDFCISCGEPMRVVDAGRPNTCLDCRPTGCPGVSSGNITTSEIDYHGGRFNSAEW